jgi:ribosomal protein L7Ae-like RNA K-turn-binding protein
MVAKMPDKCNKSKLFYLIVENKMENLSRKKTDKKFATVNISCLNAAY